MRSTVHKRAMQNYLQQANFNDNQQSKVQMMRQTTDKNIDNGPDQMTARWLDKKLSEHLDTMINMIITECNIDSYKWRKVLANSTKHAVMTIKPCLV